MRSALYSHVLWCAFLLLSVLARGQSAQPGKASGLQFDSTRLGASVPGLSSRTLKKIRKKYARLEKFMQDRSESLLSGMSRNEQLLQQKVQATDSVKAQQLFSGSQEKYKQLEAQLLSPVTGATSTPLRQYVPGLDSIKTAFRFLSQAGATSPDLSSGRLQQILAVNQQISQTEARLQQAEQVQQLINAREQELQGQLSNVVAGKQLLGINKQAYYAQQQVAEYKAMIQDKRQLEAKALSELNNVPAFQKFMQKNSYVGQVFGLPNNYGDATVLNGLQTRAQVNQLVSQAVGAAPESGGGANGDPAQYVSQQIQAAQGQMSQLKDKLSLLGNSGGGGDVTMPSFTPNDQKMKTFLKRLVVGTTVQTQGSTALLPDIANLGLTLGYKLTSNMTAGIGASYQLGVGSGWNHIAFSDQGVSVRSFFEMRAKGSWWVTGGIEYNYMQAFSKWSVLNDLDVWQRSALIGIEKKYKIAKNKQGSVQLLFDALYKEHTPTSQPLIFRAGYEL